jgi:hypothetical protein
MATRAAGLRDAMPLLGWTPVVINLLCAAVVFRLARVRFPDGRGAWLTVWLFLPANWVGQDYFSPQALNYVFYLIIIAVLLVWFRPSQLDRVRRRMRGRVRKSRSTSPPQIPRARRASRPRRLLRLIGLPHAPMLHEPEPAGASRVMLTGLMVVVLLMFTASTASHQLTPFAIVFSVTALVIARRCSVGTLPFLLLVIVLGYVSYLTVTYWSGHLNELVGSIGHLGSTINGGVTARVQGDQGHLFVLQVRQLLALSVWGLGALGAWRLMRRGHGDLALFALATAPFFLLFMQSYGGEVFLRIYTFALPFMVVLIVALIVPTWPARHTATAVVMAGVLSIGMIGTFYVARYGNESFERVLPGDAKAVDWLYANATPGVTFVALTANLPWRAHDIEQYDYTPLDRDLGPYDIPTIEAEMTANPRGAYLILTKGQYVMAEAFYGRPPGWGERIEQQVSASSHFRLIYSGDGAKIFVLSGRRG